MSAERLEVWLGDRHAGVLEASRETLAFRYADAYREDPAVTPLSLSMPLAGPKRYELAIEVRRIHQEDFCQGLAIAPGAKYENEGGPSFARCMRFTRGHADVPVRDGLALIRWLIFNYLIGNADAHAKNLSVLLQGPHVQLAPFYDLVSTAVYPEHAPKMAMKIGGHYDPAFLKRPERWQRAAADAGMNWPSFRRTLRDVVDRAAAEAGTAREEVEVEAQAGGRVALIGTIIDEVIGRNGARLDGVLGRK